MPETKMDATIKQEWIDALRSGDYPQTRGRLARTRPIEEVTAGYCCLGVLCEILVKRGILERVVAGYTIEYRPPGDPSPEDMSLHPAIIESIGLDDDPGSDYSSTEVMIYFDNLPESLLSTISNYVDPKGSDGVTLATLNDTGAPFSLIADVVEAGIEGV